MKTHLMLMRPKAKMLDRLPRILRPPQQQRIRPRRRLQRQLIQRQTLPSRLLDPGACRGRKVQRRDCQLREFEQPGVVCDGADDDEGFLGAGHFREAAEGHGWAVDAGGEEAAEDDAVEGGGGAAWWRGGVRIADVELGVSSWVGIWAMWGGKKEDVRARKRYSLTRSLR